METSVAVMSDAVLQKIKTVISQLCGGEISQPNGIEMRKRFHEDSARMINYTGHDHINENPELSGFKSVIGHYVRAMLTYPSIQHASGADRSAFRARIEEFLLSHIDQIRANKLFKQQASWSASHSTVLEMPQFNFPKWLRTIGADSVSAPMSFSFFTCLLGASANESSIRIRERTDCFTTISQKYIAHDLSARLASMSRLYNDYGSIARDRAEANINCANFAEFHIDKVDTKEEEAELKKKLLMLAEYEREAVDRTGERLIEALNRSGRGREKKIARAVTLFMGTTALFADIYVVRDLSNSIRHI